MPSEDVQKSDPRFHPKGHRAEKKKPQLQFCKADLGISFWNCLVGFFSAWLLITAPAQGSDAPAFLSCRRDSDAQNLVFFPS